MKKYIIIGAGVAGKLLAQSFVSEKVEADIVGFLDDKEKVGTSVDEKWKILGNVDDLKGIVEKYKINNIIIAVPSERGAFVRRVLLLISELNKIGLYILPRISEVVFNARVSYKDLRPVKFVDIIGEIIIKSDQEKISKDFFDKIIFISGGGGSIGSELSKQIFLLKPKKLIILDCCEKNLFSITNKINNLLDINNHTQTEFILGNINNEALLKRLFLENRIDLVFHAAAYKHVSVVEENVFEGAINNIKTTYILANLSAKYNVKKFVLVSTDKAVQPTNIMGATKRIAEKIINYFDEKSKDTIYTAVRFGNVFNSSGSAVEIFMGQLKYGNIITITDPAMNRYFMTIPEAVHLMMQSCFLTQKGKIFMLEMGKPIYILELAKCMAVLSGHKISEITFKNIGIRDGEKISEELYDVSRELKVGTEHKRIYSIVNKEKFDINCFQTKINDFFHLLDNEFIMNHSKEGEIELIKFIKELSK